MVHMVVKMASAKSRRKVYVGHCGGTRKELEGVVTHGERSDTRRHPEGLISLACMRVLVIWASKPPRL